MNKGLLFFACFALLPLTAHAYVDPGSGGAIITAVLGAIGAVGYTVRKYYYRIRRLFSRRSDEAGDGDSGGNGNSDGGDGTPPAQQ